MGDVAAFPIFYFCRFLSNYFLFLRIFQNVLKIRGQANVMTFQTSDYSNRYT
jgi:hypothetical protein